MARPVTLFTGQWADLPFETMCAKAAEFGYDGLERGSLEEARLRIVMPQQALDLRAQGLVAAAGVIEVGFALARFPLARSEE